MKIKLRLICIVLVLCLITGIVAACQPDIIDYASQVTLDLNSQYAKQEVTVKNYIDGDTTHFNVPTTIDPTGVMKARYMAINTPETTNQVEEYGKAAAAFTKSKLETATSIYVESDTATWTLDGTTSRIMAWVWYMPPGGTTYRNLNIEILQEGLAIASNAAQNRYGTTAMAALNQARELKLYVHSGIPDPDFYHGEVKTVSLMQLRLNLEQYKDVKVAVEGVITSDSGSNGVYLEEYDIETDMSYGMYIYYGYSSAPGLRQLFNQGNRVIIVGTLQYHELSSTWQIAGIEYDIWNKDSPTNSKLLSKDNTYDSPVITAEQFNGNTTITVGEEKVTAPFAQLALSTSLLMNNLVVQDIYVTNNAESSSNGAMTITCKVGEETIVLRTLPWRDSDGKLLDKSVFLGKTLNIKGYVEYYKADGATTGQYQIKVLTRDSITIVS